MSSATRVAPLGPVEADQLSSLALYQQSVGSRCPYKVGFFLLNGTTGEYFPLGCGRQKCAVCVRWQAVRTAGAVALAEPERFLRLSLVGDDWQTVRGRVRRVRYELQRRVGQAVEIAWTVERNPKGTGHHVHGFEHGAYVPQGLLAEVCDYLGMGRNTDIRKWVPQGPLSTAYGIKGLLYPMKGASDSHLEYLELNGGRLIHVSRGFCRLGKGGPQMGLEALRREWAVRRHPENGRDHWGVVYRPGWEVSL